MFKDGKFFGKINLIDIVIILAVLLFLTGIILVKSGKFITSSNKIKEIKPIEFDVATRFYDITTNRELFKTGEKSFLTIRNVPYTALEIVKAQKVSPKILLANSQNPQKPVIVYDTSFPESFCYVVTLKDTAIITPDGPIVGGNKIKIGLPIDIEGYDYRMTGMVSDVRVLK
ncbi:MAG: DUF4330 domain-containing protein [Candidatus Gastranaerophilaceae bacterium]|jgi:hypothetical protein